MTKLVEDRLVPLAVLASCRYRHAAFHGALVPFSRLPHDALWRMMGWFPGLRRLSETNRDRLVQRMAGHPRSVEFLDRLIRKAIAEWEDEHGAFIAGGLSDEKE